MLQDYITLIQRGEMPGENAFLFWLSVTFCFVLPLFFLWVSHVFNKKARLIAALPTSKVKGVFIGMVEVKGVAKETLKPLVSYLSEHPCVWYEYKIEEQWRKTTVDSKGKTSTKTGWKTIDYKQEMVSFFLEDDTGSLLVHPMEAQIQPHTVISQTCKRKEPMYYEKGPLKSISHSTHRRRFKEKTIQVGSTLYVIGTARERADKVAPAISHCSNDPRFMISVNSEEEILATKRLKSWFCAITGFLFICGIPMIVWLKEYQMDHFFSYISDGLYPLWFVSGIFYVLVWICSWGWIVYNCLVEHLNRVKQGQSLLDVQLQRRHDLIPRLTKVVSAYAEHEKMTFEELSSIRSTINRVDQGSCSIQTLTEAYPELKSQELYAELSGQIKDTEDRIALAREYFISISNHYNTSIQVFPGNVIARLFRLRPFKNDEYRL